MGSDSNRATGAKSRLAGNEIPAWVKIFGIVAVIAVAVFAALHHAGGGMEHMTHGDMGAYIPRTEQGRHVP